MRVGEDKFIPSFRPYEVMANAKGKSWFNLGVVAKLKQNMHAQAEGDEALARLLAEGRGPIRGRLLHHAARKEFTRKQVGWQVKLWAEQVEELLLRAAQMNVSCAVLVRAAVAVLLERLREELGPAPRAEGLTEWVEVGNLRRGEPNGKA